MRPALAALALAALLGAAAVALLARATGPHDAFDIAFERARLARLADRLVLDARAEVRLPDPVRAGLDSGVALEFVVALEVREPLRWWPDAHRASARWRYRLEYYELTRHYRLGSPDTDRGGNYRSLSRALEALGTLRGLTLPSGDGGGDAVGPGDRATLAMRLDVGALPLPLRPLVSSSWRVRSAPLAWSVGSDAGSGV